MAYLGYLTTEVAEDWADGLIDRREALRRLGLLGVSAAAAASFLTLDAQRAAAQSPSPSSSAAAPPSGALLPPGEPGLPGTTITFPGARGELMGHYAEAPVPLGAVLVIHENRGLTDHIRSVAGRLAAAGYSALAIDLLSEVGGTDAIADEGAVSGILGGASTERLVEDMRSGIDELQRRLPDAPLGMTGFCFGGAMVWTLLDAGEPRLAAAAPFYGPAPESPDFTGNTAAVLGVYAEEDQRVNASQDAAREALEAAGTTHQIMVYPGAGHGFFNDTGGRHDPVQAAAAWADLLAWFGAYLVAPGSSASPAPSTSPSPGL